MQTSYCQVHEIGYQPRCKACSSSGSEQWKGLRARFHVTLVLSLAALVGGCGDKQVVSSSTLEKLRSEDAAVRYEAVAALSTNKSHAAIVLLIAALGDSNRGVRIEAAETLGKWKAKEATHALIRALSDKEMWVRAQAAGALGEMRSEPAVRPLVQLIDSATREAPKGPLSTTSYGQDVNAAVFALKNITGKDFGLDVQKWEAWLAQVKPATK